MRFFGAKSTMTRTHSVCRRTPPSYQDLSTEIRNPLAPYIRYVFYVISATNTCDEAKGHEWNGSGDCGLWVASSEVAV